MEASTPRKVGDKAVLLSPAFRLSGPGCLTFWYHAFGNHVGSLLTYERSANGDKPLWKKSGKEKYQGLGFLVKCSLAYYTYTNNIVTDKLL